MCAQCRLTMYTSRQFCYQCSVQRSFPNRRPLLTYEVVPGYMLMSQIGLTDLFHLVPFAPRERLQQQLDVENAAQAEAVQVGADVSNKDKGKGKYSEDEFLRELNKQLTARAAKRLVREVAGAPGHLQKVPQKAP